MAGSNQRADRFLLLEIGLILLLLGLGVVLYWQPAADGLLSPRWWHWVVLAILFFSIVGLGARRRRVGSRTALRSTIREQRESMGLDNNQDRPATP